MKCQVCDRDFAAELSICPKCGAMMNDTVREELATKVSPSGNLRPSPAAVFSPAPIAEKNPYKLPPPATKVAPPKPPMKTVTAPLRAPKTSQTLVGFQPKNAPLPEWRLQMQNAVRSRRSGSAAVVVAVAAAPIPAPTIGATPLKIEMPPLVENADPRLGKALQRIAESRDAFPIPSTANEATADLAPAAPEKNFPFNVVEPAVNAPIRPSKPATNPLPKPKLVAPIRLDTSSLPKIELPSPHVIEIDKAPEPMIIKSTGDLEKKRIFIAAEKRVEDITETEIDEDEIEDLAPFGMRFNSGLFDMIICSVLTMLILSPFAFSNREWFTLSSMLVFVGIFALVSFVYSTVSTGFYGRTIGMKIFGLEVVDAEENEYPTLAQAAVHSALYLASLSLAGAGFAAMLFNEERRAFHDLMSGIIVVRQF